jgi:hypothetical protein
MNRRDCWSARCLGSVTSLAALALAACHGATSNGTDGQALVATNPVPTTTAVSPSSALVGSAPFVLTIAGTGFVSASTVQLNGSSRSTTFVSPTEVKATVVPTDTIAQQRHATSVELQECTLDYAYGTQTSSLCGGSKGPDSAYQAAIQGE